MSYVDYEKAQKLGMKAFKSAVSKGENEYLPVLDEILQGVDIVGEVSLGLVQIPLDRVVGTSNVGRTYAFANNFMPILDYKTEFGAKWSSLYESHVEEGIREPIKVYEYMNKFYVVEGNKRVSVLKYCEAVTVPAQVTRKVPKLTDDLQTRIYYEFMEFYKLNEINYLWFSQEGGFKKLLELTCQDPEAKWTEDQIKDFGSAHHNFNTALKKTEVKNLPLTSGDAFLIFIDIYGYDNIKNLTANEMREKLQPLVEEYLLESKGGEVQIKTEPVAAGKKRLVNYIWNPGPKKIKVAFVFDKDPGESDWLYGHELGRLYLEDKCSDKIKTLKVHDINSEEQAVTAMNDLIDMGVKVIFTTSAQQVSASLKVAAEHKDVVILNCSLNTSHKLIRTYYARLYEVKFLAGMLAGIMSRNGQIGYIADYPIISSPANINAFALGAQMVNPDAKVYLEWTKVKGVSRESAIAEFREKGVEYVSDQEMIKPNEAGRQFGLYSITEDEPVNMAMPMYLWGPFYEKLIDSVLSGAFKQEDDNSEDKAINYWWGLSAGVVDVIYSRKVPEGTRKLLGLIRQQIIDNEFSPFQDVIYAQGGAVKNENGQRMTPDEVMRMNWLVENVVGEIPEMEDLREEAKSIVSLSGVSESEEV